MKEFISSFLDYLTVERGLARNTILAYGKDLELFSSFVEGKGVVSVSRVSRQDISDFMLEQKDHEIEPASIARRLAAIKMFFRFLVRERVLKDDPTALVDSPKLWKKIPETLSVNEVEALINQPNGRSHQGIRDRAILETMYATGMRVSEAVALKLDDINFEVGFVRCVGKGNKERVVPLGKKAIASLQRYITSARPVFSKRRDVGALFVSRVGGRISRQSLWKLIKAYAAAAHI